MSALPPTDSVDAALRRCHDEPDNRPAVFRDFIRTFRAEVAAKHPPRPREVYRPYYGEAPESVTDLARLAKGVAQATARQVAEQTCATALAVTFEDAADAE